MATGDSDVPVHQRQPAQQQEAVTGVAAYVLALRALKVSAGNPSLQELQRRSGVARSTLADALSPRRRELPKLDVVLALVRACGGGAADEARWRSDWKRAARAEDALRVQAAALAAEATPQRSEAAAGRNFLPPGVADFTAREGELRAILDAAESARAADSAAPTVLAIDGMAGVGKTALVVHAAHRLSAGYPDGQFHLDLHAHTPGHTPVDPAAALDTLLRSHGCSADSIPLDPEERAAAWRAELAGRRILLIVDNAASADQVRPLLPGTGGSLVLVTSRRRLISLEGAHSIPLDPLSLADATLLFRRVLGPRADAEPQAVEDIVGLCGRLPLAIRIAAARIRHRPSWSVAVLAERLRDEQRRLGELKTSDLAVTAAFQTSFRYLAEQERRVFALLGLVPGPDIDIRAAAALVGLDADDAERSLDELLDTHLVDQLRVDRYTLHDLLRLHCAAQAAALPEAERQRALGLLLDHYRYRASVAMDAVFPDERYRRPEIKPPGGFTDGFAGSAAAVAWLDTERTNLIAAAGLSGFPRHVVDLSAVLARYLELGAHGSEALVLHQRALAFARMERDEAAESEALRHLGLTHLQRLDYQSALEALQGALTVAQHSDHQQALGPILNNLGAVYGRLGRLEQSADHFEKALRLSREKGDGANEAKAIGNLGLVRRRQGRLDEALMLHQESLELQRRRGNKTGQSIALDNLGVIHRHLGRLGEALRCHSAALILDREVNDRTGEAVTVDNLGLVHFLMGDHTTALAHFEEAAALGRQTLDVTSEGISLGNIGNVLREQGEWDGALRHHREALELIRGVDDPLNLAEALNNLGETLCALGRPGESLAFHQEALELAESCGDPMETARTRDLLGRVHHALGNESDARELHAVARREYGRMGLARAASLSALACCV